VDLDRERIRIQEELYEEKEEEEWIKNHTSVSVKKL